MIQKVKDLQFWISQDACSFGAVLQSDRLDKAASAEKPHLTAIGMATSILRFHPGLTAMQIRELCKLVVNRPSQDQVTDSELRFLSGLFADAYNANGNQSLAGFVAFGEHGL
jgi:hypothetical protein